MKVARSPAKETAGVPCEDCLIPCELVTGKLIYPHRPDLAAKLFWSCPGCAAYCGCHPGTDRPLGTPAGQATRKARMAAHAAFDPIWSMHAKKNGLSRSKARRACYRWLAGQMKIPEARCHIAMMKAEEAKLVVVVCRGAMEFPGLEESIREAASKGGAQ